MSDAPQGSSQLNDPSRLEALAQSKLMDSIPEDVFDRAVRLATQITGRPIALLSLVDDKRQFFKAQLGLTGDVAEARGTPLSHSFCQHVVTSQDALIVTDARQDPRVRENGAVNDMDVVAYLGVPVRAQTGDVLGSLCAIDSKPHVWTQQEKDAMADLREMIEGELALRKALRDNELLLGEFNHRIRNIFSVFMGIVRMTSRAVDTVEDMTGVLTDRLSAMDVAQRLVAPTGSGPRVPDEHADLGQLLTLVLAAYKNDALTICDVPVTIGPKAATAFALIVQELATNSVKYGALSADAGRLSVDWKTDGDTLTLDWVETLDSIKDPSREPSKAKRTGFGTTLLKINIENELDGTQERVFSTGQMRLTLRFPMISLDQ